MRRDLKNLIRRFFGFSRMETFGFMILVPLMVMMIFAEPVYRTWVRSNPAGYDRDKVRLDSLLTQYELTSTNLLASQGQPPELFDFNPQLVSYEELRELGFSESLANRLVNYRSKGGNFLIKTDLLKLYGMDTAFYQLLAPYIQLPDELHLKSKFESKAIPKLPEKAEVKTFDINTVDTTRLIAIYGIGSVLANRIIKYRDKLGGFVGYDQLYEVFGLDSTVAKSVIQLAVISAEFIPRKMAINQVDEKELSAHPYISRSIAKAIVTYRFQHGKFESIQDLEKIHVVDRQVISKIAPYLIFD
jgi:competence protein ComEA